MSIMDIDPNNFNETFDTYYKSLPTGSIPGMTSPAINFKDAPVNFMMRQNNPRVFDPMVNIKNFAQNLPTNFSTGLSKTFDIGKTVGTGIVSALTGLPGLSTALGLFNETPEQKALREFYEATTGLTSTGQIASGIMQGYNPVSGFGPQGLTSAIDQRIGTIKNTLKNKKSAILEARLKELEAIKAAEAKARMDAFEKSGRRAEVKDLQSRIDRGDFDGGNKDDAPGGAASNQDAQRGGQYG